MIEYYRETGWMPVLYWLLFVYLPAVLGGLVLLYCWWRGRGRCSHVLCRKCGKILDGRLPEELEVCPGCGAGLTGRRAVKLTRYRQKRFLVMSLLLFVIPVGVMCGALWAHYDHQMRIQGITAMGGATVLSNVALIKKLESNPDWDVLYRERQTLKNRLKHGQLDREACEYFMDVVIARHKTLFKGTTSQIDYNVREIIELACQQNSFPMEKLGEYVALYHSKPAHIPKQLKYWRKGEGWQIKMPVTRLHMKMIFETFPMYWFLKTVSVNGESVPFKLEDSDKSKVRINFSIPSQPAGKADVSLKFVGKITRPEYDKGITGQPYEEDLIGVYYTEEHEVKVTQDLSEN